jgi:RNA polymerase sigma-70 factor (ECF subfamily)
MQADREEAQAGLELAALFERYAPGMLAYMRMHIPSPADAEDLVVEVFLAALENKRFASLSERAQLLWLWRVARNKAIDAYRYARRRQFVALEDVGESLYESEVCDPETLALQHEDLAAIQFQINRLPAGQQEVLRLRFGQGLSCHEIATRLGKQENAIRVTLSRSLNFLRRLYARGKEGSAS